MPETKLSPSPQRLVFKTVINGPIEDVWREITRTDRPIPCFFNMRMHVDSFESGSRLRMRSPDAKYTGVVGDIIDFDPPHRFSHTFKFTQYDDPPCRVRYELTRVPEGTEFLLIIEDAPAGTKTAKQMAQGAPLIVGTLKATVEGTSPPFGMRMIHVLGRVMQPLTPRRCLSSNWS